MSAEDFEDHIARLYKPIIAEQFRRIEALLGDLRDAAVEGGADPDEVDAILEGAQFNKDGWWD